MLQIKGYLPADTTAADLMEAADIIESGYVPDETFLALVADVLRIEARTARILGTEFRGHTPAPVTIHLAQHIKEKQHG